MTLDLLGDTTIKSTNGYDIRVSAHWLPLLSLFRWHVMYGRKRGWKYAVHLVPNGRSSVRSTRYPEGKVQYKKIWLHRVITSCPIAMEVDHINHDGLDNRDDNLRIVSHSQNLMNQKPLRETHGLFYDKRYGTWVARIKVKGKSIYLGTFDGKDDAVSARREAERIYFGAYAYHP